MSLQFGQLFLHPNIYATQSTLKFFGSHPDLSALRSDYLPTLMMGTHFMLLNTACMALASFASKFLCSSNGDFNCEIANRDLFFLLYTHFVVLSPHFGPPCELLFVSAAPHFGSLTLTAVLVRHGALLAIFRPLLSLLARKFCMW